MINSSLSVKGRIKSVVIEKKCGKHSVMCIDFVPDKMEDISELDSFVSIGGTAEADLAGKLIMCGKINEVKGKITYSGAAVSVLAVSDSLESDKCRLSRIFQSPEKNYGDIFKIISDKVSFNVGDSKLSSEKTDKAVVQYNESDFEFACRIAREKDSRVFVIDNERGKGSVVIGDSINLSMNLESSDIISAERKISEYKEILNIEYRNYIELGTKVKFGSYEYVVTELQAEYVNDNDRFFMTLERNIQKAEENKNLLSVISLGKAKVVDNKDPDKLGRLQVEFLETEDAINDKKLWIQYVNTLTAGEGGVFFIPDQGEVVQIICQNGECYAYGCVREKAASDKINDTEKKSIMLYDRTLVAEDKKITFTAGEYIAQTDNEMFNVKNKDFDITMNKDSINVGNGKNRISIDKNSITIDVNRKGKITVTDSAVTIDSNEKGKAEFKGNTVDITAKGGKLDIDASSGVNIKTSKLDVK